MLITKIVTFLNQKNYYSVLFSRVRLYISRFRNRLPISTYPATGYPLSLDTNEPSIHMKNSDKHPHNTGSELIS